jgi:hypothetical protein
MMGGPAFALWLLLVCVDIRPGCAVVLVRVLDVHALR